jgi:hypothetical protein
MKNDPAHAGCCLKGRCSRREPVQTFRKKIKLMPNPAGSWQPGLVGAPAPLFPKNNDPAHARCHENKMAACACRVVAFGAKTGDEAPFSSSKGS